MSQQGTSSFGQSVAPPKPSGQLWWIASAILHVVCAAIFAAGVWGCVHSLHRVNTDSYVRAHRNAADLMPVYELFVLGIAAACALAVAYAIVGICLTLSARQAGPAMLIIAAVPAFVVGAATSGEVDVSGALASVVGSGMMATVASSLIAGSLAVGHPRRVSQRQTVVAAAPPYTGGSPYLRPPGS